MSKRATKKAAKWVQQVGDKVTMKGEVLTEYKNTCGIRLSGDDSLIVVAKSTLRPPVEVFAWKPEVVEHDPKEQERDRQDAARYRMLLHEIEDGGCLSIGNDATIELNDSFGEGIDEFDISAKLDSLIEEDKERGRKAKKTANPPTPKGAKKK